jgi:hypothetical protein
MVDTLENFGFWELDAREVFPLGTKWRLAKDWERPTKRAITAIVMHSDKISLTKASSGITSQKPNDHRDLWWLVKVKHIVSMRQVNPNKSIKGENHNNMLPYNKSNAWFFQRHIKKSQSFETSHATEKTTKQTIKITSSMTCKSLSHSLNKLPFIPL